MADVRVLCSRPLQPRAPSAAVATNGLVAFSSFDVDDLDVTASAIAAGDRLVAFVDLWFRARALREFAYTLVVS